MNQTADDKREFYRINDTVGLAYEHCPESSLPSMDEFVHSAPDSFQLINHLSRLDLDNSSLLHNIQDLNPDIARYLKLINQKIDAVAKQVVTLGLTDEFKPSQVTLSASGLSFISDTEHKQDSYMRLRLILYPSNSIIQCYGRLVRCIEADSGWDCALEYVLISEQDRDTLVRHVLQLQSNSLRNKTAKSS